ncbi:hypothetical protein VTK73DRAFT_9198 [Phialemonium thermophilum]|uniref:TeaA receptor TeaR n=1 Tax=Phialemonium thermophilum TaxID=223376 RepID=A0ABR3XM57_9PEZI
MAATSAAPTTTTLTPPSSPRGAGYSWNTSPTHAKRPIDSKLPRYDDDTEQQTSLTSYGGGYSPPGHATKQLEGATRWQSGADSSDSRSRSLESGYSSPPYRAVKEVNGSIDASQEARNSHKREFPSEAASMKAGDAFGADLDDDNSKWIHRDKLARIESEELQAAGIILPRMPRMRSKSQNRPRRNTSQDKVNGRTKSGAGGVDHGSNRSRNNSDLAAEPQTPESSSVPSWDLRLPEEIAADANGGYWVSNGGTKGASRIPIAKVSPVPIPIEHLERDTPKIRKRDGSPGEDDSFHYPKPRRARSGSVLNQLVTTPNNATPTQSTKRSATEGSPKKVTAATAAGRKTAGATKPANGTSNRPRTRGGASKDSTSSSTATRPPTRSGEIGSASNKQPEGDPPWMISAYRPDPRLPPDQQLLPTVAKRLQQEKWEREGKFGNIYDKEFRPLNDEGFLKPPEPAEEDTQSKEANEQRQGDDWPLKQEPTSPTPNITRSGSYTTMPKITDKPNLSPMPSPRIPGPPRQPTPVVRVPEVQEEEKTMKSGCACCVVM